MELFIFIIFIILWIIIVYSLINLIRQSNNDVEITNYIYRPNIEVGDKVKLANPKNNESPDLLNKEFEVTRIKDNIVFLKANDNTMLTRHIHEIQKLYNFID